MIPDMLSMFFWITFFLTKSQTISDGAITHCVWAYAVMGMFRYDYFWYSGTVANVARKIETCSDFHDMCDGLATESVCDGPITDCQQLNNNNYNSMETRVLDWYKWFFQEIKARWCRDKNW